MHTPERIAGTVLVIDREERLAEMRSLLEGEGMSVVTATSTEGGLKAMRGQRPDLVLSEVMLERPDAGFVLGYRMKQDAELSGVPLILLSSVFQTTSTVFDLTTEESRRWIKADAYMERPVPPERLVARVRALLSRPDGHRH